MVVINQNNNFESGEYNSPEVSIDSNFTVLQVSFELIEEIRKLVITIDDIRVSELESLKKKYEPKTDDNNEE